MSSGFQIFTLPKQLNVSSNLTLLSGALAYFYLTETDTPTDVYADADLTTPLTNPVQADSAGVFPVIHLDPTITYRCVLKTSAGVTLYEADPANENVLSSDNIALNLDSLKRTAAEVAAGVTPVNYAYAPFDVRRYGLTSASSASVNSAAINSALQVAAAAGGGIVQLPGGDIPISGDSTTPAITVPSRVQLRGVGKGYGVSSATVLRYVGAGGVGIQIGTSGASAVDGFYSSVRDLILKQDADNGASPGTNTPGTIGIRFSAVHGAISNVTITAQLSIGWSTAALLTETGFGTFTLYLEDCYISDNAIGFDCTRGQDFKVVNCYFERNGTNVRIGNTSTVISFAMIGGVQQLLGKGYSGDTNETDTSVGVDVVDCRGFHYAGVYSENNGGNIATSTTQRAIVLRTCRGGSITGCTFGSSALANSAVKAIHTEANARGVSIAGNHFNGYSSSYAITRDAGAMLDIGINNYLNSSGVFNPSWTPSPTGMTVINGTGGVTYSGTWDRKGNLVTGTIKVTPTGTATSAATANTTYFAFDSAMPSCTVVGTCEAVDDSVASYGVGAVFTNNRIYMPTWAAVNKPVYVGFRYLTSDAT